MTRANRQHEARGFTLMELMVVMGIIVLLLSMGVLAFNALTGRRSISMAQNQVANMLGRARALAMRDSGGVVRSVGVFFFLDPQTDRTAMVIVTNAMALTGDADPNEQYKPWTPGATYQVGDRVVAITKDLVENGGIVGGGKPMARRFYCKIMNIAGNANCPPLTGTTFPFSNTFWQEVEAGFGADVFPGEDFELLPAGVGVQTAVGAFTGYDRYLRTGMILFDQQGRLESQPYVVGTTSVIGQRMGLIAPIGGTRADRSVLYSQGGVVLYDTEMFRNQSGFTEADYDPVVQLPGQPVVTAAAETPEEAWLDVNTSLLLVNRYSGELLRAR